MTTLTPVAAGARLVAIVCCAFAAGCVRFPDALPADTAISLDDVEVSASDLDAWLDRYTDSHRDGGSNMTLLTDPETAYAAFVDLIESAHDHLHVETLNFDNDAGAARDVALEFAQRFARKAREGVEVNMIVDPAMEWFLSRPEIEQTLRDGGVNLRWYRPQVYKRYDFLLYHTHKKILLADGRDAIVGSMNFGIHYFSAGYWRDTDVRLAGPVVATVQREFIRDWNALGADLDGGDSRYFPTLDASGPLSIRAIDQRPAENDFDINTAILIGLRAARDTIDIESPYLNPTDSFADELVAAAGRGVRVRILTNSRNAVDIAQSFYGAGIAFGPLLDGGVEIHLWDSPSRTMHSKAMVFDDRMAIVSSHNLNSRSILWDAENGVVFTDPPAVAAVREMIDADFAADEVFPIDRGWLDTHGDAGDLLSLFEFFRWLF